jgi:outer membrane protein TolC
MSEVLTIFQEAKAQAEHARQSLIEREAELKVELAEIKQLLGRKPRSESKPRKPKAAPEQKKAGA